jgi:hypothetical protein
MSTLPVQHLKVTIGSYPSDGFIGYALKAAELAARTGCEVRVECTWRQVDLVVPVPNPTADIEALAGQMAKVFHAGVEA